MDVIYSISCRRSFKHVLCFCSPRYVLRYSYSEIKKSLAFTKKNCVEMIIFPPFGTIFVEMEYIRMSSAMFGRMFATSAYYICLQYASEIFPASIRASGLSLCEIIGGIGLFISPWIVYLVGTTYQHNG